MDRIRIETDVTAATAILRISHALRLDPFHRRANVFAHTQITGNFQYNHPGRRPDKAAERGKRIPAG